MEIKKILLSVVFMAFGTAAIQAQNSLDTITVNKVILGYKYTQGDLTYVGFSKMKEVVSSNPEAYHYIRKANNNTVVASIFGGIGGAIAGFQLGFGATSGTLNRPAFTTGLSLIALSVPFTIVADRSGNKGVRLYNAGLNTTTQLNKPTIKLSASSAGLAISWLF